MNKFLWGMGVVALGATTLTGYVGFMLVIDKHYSKMATADWLDLSNFMTNMLTPFFAFLSLCVLVSTLRTQNHQIELTKHSNAIATTKANIERLNDELLKILSQTKVKCWHQALQTVQISDLHEVYISKSIALFDSLPDKGLLLVGKHSIGNKLVELAVKMDVLESNLCELEIMTHDYSRRKEAIATYKMLMRDLEQHGYLKHVIEPRNGSITSSTPSIANRTPLV